MSVGRRALVVGVAAGLAAGALATGAGAVSAGVAARQQFFVGQVQFPPPLVVRGELVEVGYNAQTSADAVGVPRGVGTLYVRNDLQRTYTAVALKLRRGRVWPYPMPDYVRLRALVPQRLLSGNRLFYYAVIRNPRSGRSVTVPAGGARAPESVGVINHAFRLNLGTYQFGHLKPPGQIVAKAGPTQVGFINCAPGVECGQPTGPWSFEIARDRSIWMLDQENNRVLVWAAGHPDAIARTLSLPDTSPRFTFGDFALGPAGSLYFVRSYAKAPPLAPGDFPPLRLSRVSASGKVLWTSKLYTSIANTQLRTGPDGTLWTGAVNFATLAGRDDQGWKPWAPAATPAGRPVSLAQQRARLRWALPLPGGRQIVTAVTGWTGVPYIPVSHEVRFALIGPGGRVLRAWRITSRTSISPAPTVTPALVGGDPVVVLWPTEPRGGEWHREYLVLRLGPRGGVRTRFSLPWNDPPESAFAGYGAITDIRIQPDGWLYQLGSAPDFGAAIYRYSLAPTR
jgi:hypothetical protein